MFRRRVVDHPGFTDTAVSIGRAIREGQLVDINGQPMFFRDLPHPGAQKAITTKTARPGDPSERVFSPEEVAQVQAAAAVNKQLNDNVLIRLQELYDAQDPMRLAGAALGGAAGGAGLLWLIQQLQGSSTAPASAQQLPV